MNKKYIICFYILRFRPRGLKTRVGEVNVMWDPDAHTEHLQRPAAQKSKANRVHIQSMHCPMTRKCGWKQILTSATTTKPNCLLPEIDNAINTVFTGIIIFFKTSLTPMPVKLKKKSQQLHCWGEVYNDKSLNQCLQQCLPFRPCIYNKTHLCIHEENKVEEEITSKTFWVKVCGLAASL